MLSSRRSRAFAGNCANVEPEYHWTLLSSPRLGLVNTPFVPTLKSLNLLNLSWIGHSLGDSDTSMHFMCNITSPGTPIAIDHCETNGEEVR